MARAHTSRLEVGLVLLVLAIATVTRLANLLGRDPFVDEVAWLRWVVTLFNPNDPMALWLPITEEERPPLFFWLELATVNLSDNALVGGRLAAALPGIASTLALYVLARELLGIETALISALLWSLSPLSVFFSRVAADDALLTLWTILAALTSAVFVQRQSTLAGAACGVCLGLAIFTKPLGVLALPMPLLAWLLLSRRRLTRPLLLGALALLASLVGTLYPLAAWTPKLLDKVSVFADISVVGSTTNESPLARVLRLDLLQKNLPTVIDWLGAYVGYPLLAFAAVGTVVGLIQRRGPLVFLALIGLIPLVALVDRATALYTRYFVFCVFPLYVLAGAAMAWSATTIARQAPRIRARWADVRSGALAAAVLVVGGAVLPTTYNVVAAPERAALPAVDRKQYFDQWFAFFGLGRIAGLIGEAARLGNATVVVPVDAYPQQRVGDALQLYLRNRPAVQFVEDKSLNEGWSLCPLRRWLTSPHPVFLVLDAADPGAGEPASMPAYTRTVQAALARDLPEVTADLSIPRPSGEGFMATYRLDGRSPAALASVPGSCTAPKRSFGKGWHAMDKLLGGSEPAHWTSEIAEYAEGPVPAGWYRVVLYARALGALENVTVSINDISVGAERPLEVSHWQWIESSRRVWVAGGENVRVKVRVDPAPGAPAFQSDDAPARLVVGRLILEPTSDDLN